MGITTSILFGRVMHKRLFPRVNVFNYGIYYLAFPLSQMKSLPVAHNRFAPISFYDRDHGNRDGSSLQDWCANILKRYNITEADGEITLICMPRVFGYVFNPVSFWVCRDKAWQIRAILCEVNNTFGETHSYLCAHPDHRPIIKGDIMQGDKVFHVSPFLQREGHYTFRFDITDENCGIWIDFYNEEGEKQLITALNGPLQPMTKQSLRKAFLGYPLVTLKAITLIHWQAVKLVVKGIKYVPKPLQKEEKLTAMNNITKL